MLARTPTAAPLLLPAVREELAVRALGRDAACLRLRGCLALGEAAGGGPLREGVLAAAVRCLLDLDVDIRWQDIAAVPGAAPTRARSVGDTFSWRDAKLPVMVRLHTIALDQKVTEVGSAEACTACAWGPSAAGGAPGEVGFRDT